MKGNAHKIFHLSAKLIASDSDIEEAFKSMHQSIMTKQLLKDSPRKYWVVETILKHSINIFEKINISRNNSIKRWR